MLAPVHAVNLLSGFLSWEHEEITGGSTRSLESELGWFVLAWASLCSAVRDLKGSPVLRVTFVPTDLCVPGAVLSFHFSRCLGDQGKTVFHFEITVAQHDAEKRLASAGWFGTFNIVSIVPWCITENIPICKWAVTVLCAAGPARRLGQEDSPSPESGTSVRKRLWEENGGNYAN